MPQVVVAVVSFIGTVGATTVAAVAGASALSAISVGAMFAIGAGVIAGGLMLANKLISSLYEMPKMDTDASRQRTVKGTIEPQKILYGQNLVSGPISFVGTYGDKNRVLAHAVVLAGHEVEEIVDIYFDDEVITDSQIDANGYVTSGTFGPKGNKSFAFGVTNFGTNICKINRYTGASGQTADPDLVSNFFSYTSDHVGTGLAYITTHWLLKDGSQKTWDQYSPQNIKATVKGRKVYDPRTTLTAYSDNPALCLADYLTNTDFGMGIASAKIDWDSVEAAANACDVTVSVPSGTEKRFACNGVLFGTDSHKTNINKILSSMNGLLSFTNGKYVIRAGVYEAPTVNLDEDNLIGAVSIKTSFERSDRFNTVTGTFIDPAQNYKATEFPEVQLTAALSRDNGEVLSKDIQLPMTNSSYMAQRIAHKLVQISDQQKVVTFPTNLAGIQIAIGDRVSVSLEEFNWSNKVFICLGWTFSDSGNGGVNLILREDDSGSYADPAVGEYSTVSATGGIIKGFKGFPDPQNLTATAGLKSIELNWDNPDNMSDIEQIEVFASPNSNWSSAVKIGSVSGTQFTHDESNAVDSVAIGDTRYYWVRARGYSVGDSAEEVSDRNPDNDISNITATVGALPWTDVAGDDKPEDNATVGATIGTDLKDESFTVVGGADVLNQHDFFLITTDSNQAPSGAEFSAVAGRNPREGDTVITRDTSGTIDVTYAWQYSGSAWTQISTFISGDLLVDGSITANELAADSVTTDKLNAGAVTSDKISVSQLSAISADMGALTAGSITLGDTPPTAGSAPTSDQSGAAIDNDGKITLGNETNYVAFDGSTVTVRGSLNADDITAGELDAELLNFKNFNNLVRNQRFNGNEYWPSGLTTGTVSGFGTAAIITSGGYITQTLTVELPITPADLTGIFYVKTDSSGITYNNSYDKISLEARTYSGTSYQGNVVLATINFSDITTSYKKATELKPPIFGANITHVQFQLSVSTLTSGTLYVSEVCAMQPFRGEGIVGISGSQISATNLAEISTSLGQISDGTALELRFRPANSAPSSPATGLVYFDNGTKKLRCWDGTAWDHHSTAGYLTTVALDDLTDVTLGTPTDGQALVYNNTTSQWEPATISISGGNAETLDGLDSTQFLRSDADDSTTGSLTVGGNLSITGDITINNIIVAPVISATNIVGETIEIVFNESTTADVEAYQVYSSVDGGAYGLIAHIAPESFAATMTVVDATFVRTGVQIDYRVYAVKYGIYSSAATTSKTYTTPSLDVSNMSVVPSNTDFTIQYEFPDSRFVDHIEIYMDAEASQGSLSRTGATLIYSGLNTSYTYPIGSSDLDKYHQFWVEVVSS